MNIGLRRERNPSALALQRDAFHIHDESSEEEDSPVSRYSTKAKLMTQQSAVEAGVLRQDRVPIRKIDLSAVHPDVLLANKLTPEQEKSVYFPLERYRLLSTRLIQVARNLKTKIFLVTSAIAEEGKTLTTTNLAFALSGASTLKTLVIDLDLRRPSLASSLGLKESKADGCFLSADDWRDCLWELKPNLHALLMGSPAERPEEAVHSEAVKRILEESKAEYDLVIVDSAPLLLAVDTHVLLPMIDHALLVVRADHTPISCSQDAIKMLGEKGLGCVLNDVKKMRYEEYYRAYYK